jgi:hypothetical protein
MNRTMWVGNVARVGESYKHEIQSQSIKTQKRQGKMSLQGLRCNDVVL